MLTLDTGAQLRIYHHLAINLLRIVLCALRTPSTTIHVNYANYFVICQLSLSFMMPLAESYCNVTSDKVHTVVSDSALKLD